MGRRDQLETPLAQILAVAVEAWAPDSTRTTAIAGLVETLASTLADSRGGRPLWVLWQRLAFSRVELPPALRAELGYNRLGPLAQATASLVLVDGEYVFTRSCEGSGERPRDQVTPETAA